MQLLFSFEKKYESWEDSHTYTCSLLLQIKQAPVSQLTRMQLFMQQLFSFKQDIRVEENSRTRY